MLYKGMTNLLSLVADLSDAALTARVASLAERERQTTAELIASLAEFDVRRLYLGAGCSSLFTYCTQVLHLSEHAAYGRIEAARAARRFPVILERLADGTLTLTAVCLLAPLLTADNHLDLLNAARHKSKREVAHLVAGARPQAAVPSSVRKVPAPRPVALPVGALADERIGDRRASVACVEGPVSLPAAACAPPRPAVVRPLAPERYKVQFTVPRETYDLLRRAQDLLRHTIPTGDPAAIFGRALTLLVEDLERKKLAAATRPRAARPIVAASRHVPAAVRREVWKRDGGQCGFIGTKGRCEERGFLEFHHAVPFAAGGETSAGNLQLRCRAHNAHEAELYFGPLLVREVAAPYGA